MILEPNTQPYIQLTLEQINEIVDSLAKPKEPKSFSHRLKKAWEKKFFKGIVSVPSFVLGFAASSFKAKDFIVSLFF